jgi:hypothetical protein
MHTRQRLLLPLLLAPLAALLACGDGEGDDDALEGDDPASIVIETLSATIGPEGGRSRGRPVMCLRDSRCESRQER